METVPSALRLFSKNAISIQCNTTYDYVSIQNDLQKNLNFSLKINKAFIKPHIVKKVLFIGGMVLATKCSVNIIHRPNLFLTKKAIKQIKKEKNMHYINIKGKQIQTIIREYTTSNNLKIYFKGNILNISKPKRMTFKKLQKVIKENENEIYNQYNKIMSNENDYIKHWKTGEKIPYQAREELGNNINQKLKRIKNTRQTIPIFFSVLIIE